MATTTEIIDVTPDKTLMPKLGKSGYSVPQAIAELLDNAIDARIEGALLHVSVTIGKSEITVADDGTGMNHQEMQDSMILGRSSKHGQLGEFGLGLKTACTSLGRAFAVTSSKLGEPFEYAVEYDEKRWVSSKDHWKMQLSVSDRDAHQHFTIVRVFQLERSYSGLADTVRRDVQRRFAPLIAGDDVEIRINKKPCAPEGFDLLDGSRREFLIEDEAGRPIRGWYGLLKQGSNKGYYGFHTYRRGRMITTFDKLAIGEHPTISRIIGEIHMDHVPVTHNKREWEQESLEYQAAVRALKNEFAELLRLARQKASSDMLDKTVRNEMERWKDALARAMTSSEMQSYGAEIKTPSDSKRHDGGTETANVEVEKRASPVSEAVPPLTDGSPRERVPRQVHKRPRHVVKVRGHTVDFRHEFAPLGEREVWFRWAFDPEKGLDIYTNTDFPAYFTTRDKAFYAAIHIAESISQLIARECALDAADADDVRQLILRKAAAVKDQWIEEEPSAD